MYTRESAVYVNLQSSSLCFLNFRNTSSFHLYRNRSIYIFIFIYQNDCLLCFRLMDKAKKTLDRLKDQLIKLEVQETDKEENKTIALGTSKLNYLDPRISVAWYVWMGMLIVKTL